MDILLGIPKNNVFLGIVFATTIWALFAFTRPKKKKVDTKKYSVVVDAKELIRRAPESPDKVGISTSLIATGLLSHPPVLLVRESASTLILSV